MIDTQCQVWSDLHMQRYQRPHGTDRPLMPPSIPAEQLWFSYAEVAGIYGISVATVRRMAAHGRFPVAVVGRLHRIHRIDVEGLAQS